VEIEKNREELINLRQQRDTMHASMNRLLNRPAGTPFSGIPRVSQTDFSYSCDELEKQALEGHPLLQALEQHIRQREAECRLAQKSYFPHFVVTAAYGQRDDRMHVRPTLTRVIQPNGASSDVTTRPLNYDTDRSDFFSFVVGVTVPIWFSGKQNRRVSETRLQIEQAKAEYDARKNDILFSIRDLVARIRRGADLLDLYDDSIIPKAAQSFSADMAAYQVDRIDFLTLLDSQITLYNYRIELERILSDYEKNLADLEVAVGKKLFQIEAGNKEPG
jgi:outer membrane protein TolC